MVSKITKAANKIHAGIAAYDVMPEFDPGYDRAVTLVGRAKERIAQLPCTDFADVAAKLSVMVPSSRGDLDEDDLTILESLLADPIITAAFAINGPMVPQPKPPMLPTRPEPTASLQ